MKGYCWIWRTGKEYKIILRPDDVDELKMLNKHFAIDETNRKKRIELKPRYKISENKMKILIIL